jgi:hypothetical protein
LAVSNRIDAPVLFSRFDRVRKQVGQNVREENEQDEKWDPEAMSTGEATSMLDARNQPKSNFHH